MSHLPNHIKIIVIITALFCQSVGDSSAETKNTFMPTGCEYSIEFPGRPTIEEYASPETPLCKTTSALLITMKGKGGLRAECTRCDNNRQGRQYDKQSVIRRMKEHAKVSGVSNAVFGYKKSELGPIGWYRGELSAVGNTFVCVWILGPRSGLSVVGSAPYNLYQVLGFEKFLGSVKRH